MVEEAGGRSMATAASSSSNSGPSTATATLLHGHRINNSQTRKRIDPRRRQAALSFLNNISLDGRPVQGERQEAEDVVEERESEVRTCVTERGASTSTFASSSSSTAALAAAATALANQTLVVSSRTTSVASAASASSEPGDGEPFTPAFAAPAGTYGSPLSALAASARGRLQTYTPGVPPVAYSRQGSQNYCLEGGPIANSAMELQRSR